jgi:hypothetical protein
MGGVESRRNAFGPERLALEAGDNRWVGARARVASGPIKLINYRQ